MRHVSEELRVSLKSIIDHFDQEDRSVRDRQIRLWRRLKLYWDGFQRVWFSETAHDWRIDDDIQSDTDHQNEYYDKPVNVFQAYLQSIIAALSVTVPPVKCSPDDADNPLDMSTAKAGNSIAELIYKHNDVTLLWLHALFVYCTEGLIACHNYTKEDKEYGTYQENQYKDFQEDHYVCPECEEQVDETFENRQIDVVEDQEISPLDCPECGALMDPMMGKTTQTIKRIVGVIDHPKSRQILEVHGGLYVKIVRGSLNTQQQSYFPLY